MQGEYHWYKILIKRTNDSLWVDGKEIILSDR